MSVTVDSVRQSAISMMATCKEMICQLDRHVLHRLVRFSTTLALVDQWREEAKRLHTVPSTMTLSRLCALTPLVTSGTASLVAPEGISLTCGLELPEKVSQRPYIISWR